MNATADRCRVCSSKSIRRHCDPDNTHCKWRVCRECGSYGYMEGRWYNKPKNTVMP